VRYRRRPCASLAAYNTFACFLATKEGTTYNTFYSMYPLPVQVNFGGKQYGQKSVSLYSAFSL